MGAFLEAVTTWDASVITAIYENVHSAFLTMFFRIVTLLGEGGIFWIAVAVILLFFKKTRRSGICIGASLLIGVIVGNGIIKNVVARPRPYDAIAGIESVVSHLSDYSFPSGHSLCCFEAATALEVGYPRICRSGARCGVATVPFCSLSDRRYLRRTARRALRSARLARCGRDIRPCVREYRGKQKNTRLSGNGG